MTKVKYNLFRYASAIGVNGFGLLTGIFMQIALARMMGAQSYGLFTLVTTIVLLTIKLSDLGVFAALNRMMALYYGEKSFGLMHQLLRESFNFTALIGFVLAFAIGVGAQIIGGWFSVDGLATPLLILSFFIPVIYIFRWAVTILNSVGYNTIRVFIEAFLLPLFTAFYTIILWLETESILSVVFGYGAAYVSVSFFALLYLKLAYKQVLAKQSCKPEYMAKFSNIIAQGIPMSFSSMGQKIFQRGDVIVIGVFLGETAVGIYKVANTIAAGVKQISAPLNSFADYIMSRKVGEKEQNIIRYFVLTVWGNLMITLPLYFIIYSFADEIINLVFGSQFLGGVQTLKILCLGFIFFVSTGPMASFFCAVGKNWTRMWIFTFAAILNVILNVSLVQKFGIEGAAISTALSFFIVFISFTYFSRVFYKNNDFKQEIGLYIMLVIFMGVLHWIYIMLNLQSNLVQYYVILLYSIIIFVICLIKTYNSYLRIWN